MKKTAFVILVFAMLLSACMRWEPEAFSKSEPAPTPVPEFGVQEYFTSEEMEHELQFVEYSCGFAGFQLFLPSDWHYEIVEYQADTGEFGVNFCPDGIGNGMLFLRYYGGMFGVCGTGLVEVEGELPGAGKLRAGYYDGNDYPTYISFYDAPGGYALTSDMGDAWNSHWDDIEKILGSLVLDPGIIRLSAAEEIAIAQTDVDYDYINSSFDIFSGEIYVSFVRMGGEVRDGVLILPDEILLSCTSEKCE